MLGGAGFSVFGNAAVLFAVAEAVPFAVAEAAPFAVAESVPFTATATIETASPTETPIRTLFAKPGGIST